MNTFAFGFLAGMVYMLIGVAFLILLKSSRVWEATAAHMADTDPKISRETLTVLVLFFWFILAIIGLVGMFKAIFNQGKKKPAVKQPEAIYIVTQNGSLCYFCHQPFTLDNPGHIVWIGATWVNNPSNPPGYTVACRPCLAERGIECACHPRKERAN